MEFINQYEELLPSVQEQSSKLWHADWISMIALASLFSIVGYSSLVWYPKYRIDSIMERHTEVKIFVDREHSKLARAVQIMDKLLASDELTNKDRSFFNAQAAQYRTFAEDQRAKYVTPQETARTIC